MIPYKVLGVYHPPILPADRWNESAGIRCWKIGEDLTDLTHQLGFKPLHDPLHGPQTWVPWHSIKLHAEVLRRHPGTHKAEDFHQDGDLIPSSNMNHCLVVWSNKTPTEFQYNGKVYQPKPFEVVMAHNLKCYHRRPANAPKERFFFHQCVEDL